MFGGEIEDEGDWEDEDEEEDGDDEEDEEDWEEEEEEEGEKEDEDEDGRVTALWTTVRTYHFSGYLVDFSLISLKTVKS